MEFIQLPEDIKDKIRYALHEDDKATVILSDGKYVVGKLVGTYELTDIPKSKEYTENYINKYLEYPIWYNGIRDMQLLTALKAIKALCYASRGIEKLNPNLHELRPDDYKGFIDSNGNFTVDNDVYTLIQYMIHFSLFKY